MLAVCHTCMLERDPNFKDDDIRSLKYSASSPDELALVVGAKEVGLVFNRRSASTITIKINNNQEDEYETLVEFPFDSTRKRMSLLVRNNTTKRYYLMCKGADSIMLPRIKIDIATQQRVEADLYRFACEGLRTLVFSKKELA